MNKKLLNLLLSFFAFLLVIGCVGTSTKSQSDYLKYVNPLQGSNSVREFSTGNTYPAVSLPWGMNFWTPQTREMGDGWQYTYNDITICGFKQTHQPSPWINDFGCFSIMPVNGDVVFDESKRASVFNHSSEVANPHYYSVELETYGIKAELTPSSRGAIFNFTFPQNEQSSVIIDCFNKGGYIKILPDEQKIVGYSRFYAPNNDAILPDNFATYFVITLDKPFEVSGTWKDGEQFDEVMELEGEHVGGFITFKTKKDDTVTARVASSFISIEQAQLNYNSEVDLVKFDKLKEKAADEWNSRLSRTTIKGATEEQMRTFYTALYRTMLFPHSMHEYDKEGRVVHYSPFTGTEEEGLLYTGNGFWDTFRAVHPYFNIMYPEFSADIMETLINYYDEGGWLPEWFSPGYRNCMIGQNSSSVVADAYLKGINVSDIDKLWEAVIKGANNAGPNATGRDGFQYYNELGYIPNNVGVRESVSKTLEYSYNDFCIWQLGKALGKPAEEIEVYRERAMNYRNIFDQSINFVRPKDDKGNWESSDTWQPDTWGGSFTEGSSWHWTWSVFHDPKGLIDLMGGDEKFIEKMDSVFIAEPTIDMRHRRGVIHEMTEMIACKMGQYAHGNQPIQHMIYLYNYAGAPYKAQYHAREVMDKLYSSGWEDGTGLCGDEDNGQTSAWYVFSAMGFYPVNPVSHEFIIGSPLFGEISLSLNNGKTFTVKANNNSSDNVYIQSAMLNGESFERGFITYNEIMNGGVLEFEMGPEPNKEWASAEEFRPTSLS